MRDELKRFLESVRNDPPRLEEFRALINDPDAAIRWVESQGFQLTPEDIAELLDSDRELSDDDLDQAAGGDGWPPA
jgi:predicted ribosomally synthesized peptide with nif11-like leader